MIDFKTVKPVTVQAPKDQPVHAGPSLFDFEVVEIYERRLQESPKAASRLNDAMAFFIAAFVFLVPIPFGANRPLAWLAAVVVLGVAVTVYFALLTRLDPNRPVQWRNYRWIVLAGIGAIIAALFQLVPLGMSAIIDLPEQMRTGTITVSVSSTALAIPRMISYALLFVLVSEVCTNSQRTEKLLKWVFYVIVAHGIWAMISLSVLGDTLLFLEKQTYEGFATGTFINRNSFATFMGMGIVIGTGLVVSDIRAPARRSPNRKSRTKGFTADAAFMMVFVFIALAAVLASGSRLGLGATVIGAWATVVAILLRTGVPFLRVTIGSAILGVVGVGALAATFGSELLERLVYILVDSDTRLELYRQTIAMIQDRPLFGFGLDSYEAAFQVYHQPELNTSLIWDKPHNTYLTLWSELGLLAGSLPMIAVLIAFVYALRTLAERDRGLFPPAVVIGVIVLGAIHSLGDFSLEIPANTYVFVAIVAIGLSRRSRMREY